MVDMAALRARNAARWAAAKPTRNFISVAKSLVSDAAKAQYQAVQKYTGVPWYIIAVIHERESSQNWKGNLAQGDPWNAVSIHVPKGRGPFESWKTAAIDALVNCSPYAARNHDWSVGGALTVLEEYNGLGYAARGLPSPYVWSGTDQYIKGKYVRDGVFDPNEVDKQFGCAGLLMAMMQLDKTIVFGGSKLPIDLPSDPPPDEFPNGKITKNVVPSPKPVPAPNPWATWIVSIFKSIFGK